MKILHTADWHIGQFKGPVVDGVNLRSQDTVKCLEYMVQVAIEEKPDIVCVSGDIFHQEQVGPVRYSDEMITATNIITFKSDEYTIYTRLIEGKYFAYQKMFTEGEINTCASRTALIGAMTRAKMCTEEKQPAVFQIEDDVLNISIRDKLADYQEQVPLQETVCKSIRLGFDSRLVLETLKAFTCDNIALGFTSPRTPMIVEAEDSDMKAMVLPVAIREV